MHLLGKGDTDVRVMREAISLVEAGLAVTVVDTENDRARPREETAQGVRIKHARTPTWPHLGPFKLWLLPKASQMLGSLFTVLRTPADVYHAHDITALPACYLAAVLRRKHLVYDAHELPVTDPSITRRPVLRWLTAALLRGMMPRCDGVLTVSPPIVAELQRRYGGPTATVVRNLPVYQPPVTSDRLRRLLKLDAESRIALYHGGLQNNRSLDRLIYAARFLAPGNVIVLMGKGPIQAQLERLIIETGVGDQVKIVPAVPYEELLEWAASADIGLTLFLPSYSVSIQLCLPNKLFEYLMVGLPVLTSPLEAIVDIVQRYEVGRMVSSLEPEAIGKAINDLLADSQALEEMRTNALRASETDLHWEVESGRLITLYQHIASFPNYGGIE
ncbi:MAG TPA: glycosyltransferase family 4 protein [Ktedonobacterales bacterium]|jgi:glycosyltransferase involved in cell wall biosynthesis